MKRAVTGKGWHIKATHIKHHTDDYFIGYYKNNYIEITRENPPDGDRNNHPKFYITVNAPDGCHLYEGYFGTEQHTMMDAITEALAGSHLINRKAAA